MTITSQISNSVNSSMGSAVGFTVYSFKDLSGAISHPLAGSFIFTGEGNGQIKWEPMSERTMIEMSVQGVPILARMPEAGGKVEIHCQQSGGAHKWLLLTYNKISNSEAGAEDWGKINLLIRNTQDGSQLNFKGVAFSGLPLQSWAATGDYIVWSLTYATVDIAASNPSGAGQTSLVAKQLLL